MTRWKSSAVLTAAAIGCGMISYLVVRAFAVRDEDIKFVSGSDKMRLQGKQLKSINFNFPAPSDVPARFVRRGILGCYQYSGCSFVLLDPTSVRSLN